MNHTERALYELLRRYDNYSICSTELLTELRLLADARRDALEEAKAAIREDIAAGARMRVLRSPNDYADVACGAVDRVAAPRP